MKKYLKYFWIIPIAFIFYLLVVSNNLTFDSGKIELLNYVYIDFGFINNSFIIN